MRGTIGLKDLRIDCIVGIYPHERTELQPLFLDVEVDQDFAAAAAAEHVDQTVDYDHIAAGLTALAVDTRYQLLETFAEDGAALILDRWASAQAVRIEIRKPRAVPAAACSFVRVERAR